MAGIKIVSAVWGDAFDERYVDAIKAQIPDIIVLSAGDGLYEPSRYRGWWCKLELFRPENRHLRPCLFVDLDTFVFDLDEIRDVDASQLWLIKNFYMPEKSNSGLFVAPDTELSDKIWEGSRRLDTQTHGRGAGDGDYLATFPHKRLTDEIDGIYSYKADHIRERGLAPNTRVVCFHGRPKPHQCDGWAREHFESISRTQRRRTNPVTD